MTKARRPPADTGEVGKGLAGYLLSLSEGDQLLRTRELARRLRTSTGSVSNGVNRLEEMGAVRILRRGRIGSSLEGKSVSALWGIVEAGPMVIAMNMPSFPKSEGLATAIYCMLNNAGVETYLVFIRGSCNRLKALRDGRCHAAIMSSLAADELCGRREKIILRLPPGSFVTDHRVFYRPGKRKPGQALRVAMDKDSFDIEHLTELEFADGHVDYQRVTYMQIGRHLLEGYVDAAVWNTDEMRPFVGDLVRSRPLSPKVRGKTGDRDTSAAIVARSEGKHVSVILEEILDIGKILETQQQILAGELVPRY